MERIGDIREAWNETMARKRDGTMDAETVDWCARVCELRVQVAQAQQLQRIADTLGKLRVDLEQPTHILKRIAWVLEARVGPGQDFDLYEVGQ